MKRAAFSLLLGLTGCSLVFDPSGLMGGELVDAGPDGGPDAGAPIVRDGGPDAGDAGPQVDAGPCAAPLVMCGVSCADTQTSAAHCGGCDNACAAGQTCGGGRCRPAVEVDIRFGGSGWDSARGVAVDDAGNIYLAGEFRDQVDFGGGAETSAGGIDGFVASFAADGVFRWARPIGGTGDDVLRSVAIDPAVGVVAVGYMSGTFDPGTGSLTTAGGTDGLVVALDPATGAVRWARGFGGGGDDSAKSVAISGGAVYVAGDFSDAFTFIGAAGPLAHGGMLDGVALRFNATTSSATPAWAFPMGGTGNDAFEGVAVAADGAEVCLGGFFEATVMIGGSPRTSEGNFDGIVACLSSGGAHQWNQPLASTGFDQVSHVAFGSDFLAASGIFEADTSFGSSPLVTGGGWDAAVLTLERSGAPRWAVGISSPGLFDYVTGIDVGPDDRIAVVGLLHGEVTLPGLVLPHAGGVDAFVGVWLADGSLDWARMYGAAEDDSMLRPAFSSPDALWLAGEFHATVDFGRGARASVGDYDAFALRVLP